MDISVFKKIVYTARTLQSGLPYFNTLRAIHAVAVRELGAERVGDLSLYPASANGIIWTLELCKLEALLYRSRTEWAQANRTSYRTATKNNWVELCCKHMVVRRKKWTLAICQQDALKYKTRTHWAKYSLGYNAAKKNGWIELCCGHMRASHMVNQWSLESCAEDAKKYKTKISWKTNSASAYNAAHRNGWSLECCAHMSQTRKSWPKESCLADAKNYSSRYEWQKQSNSAYNAALKNGWLAECCEHMTRRTARTPSRSKGD